MVQVQQLQSEQAQDPSLLAKFGESILYQLLGMHDTATQLTSSCMHGWFCITTHEGCGAVTEAMRIEAGSATSDEEVAAYVSSEEVH